MLDEGCRVELNDMLSYHILSCKKIKISLKVMKKVN